MTKEEKKFWAEIKKEQSKGMSWVEAASIVTDRYIKKNLHQQQGERMITEALKNNSHE